MTLEDAAALAAVQRRSRQFLAPWEPMRADAYFTAEGQRADISAALGRHDRGEAMPWVILDGQGDIAGRVTLNGIVRGPFQSCSMGYWLAQDQTGKGLATEAVRDAVMFAFKELDLHRVQAETLVNNVASRRVLLRTGFNQYGLAPKYLRIAGQWQDHLMFQRINDRNE
ncbi:GNAT family N-acetyltransferase [Nesterenkonia halotolerans]|uniref:GNAT family N-acetyltransferase n=1 Tax=Nesterenkonia halotolerans TaxID=225325 RepID=UPI003EE75BE7